MSTIKEIQMKDVDYSVIQHIRYLTPPQDVQKKYHICDKQIKVISFTKTDNNCPLGSGLILFELEQGFRVVKTLNKGFAWFKKRDETALSEFTRISVNFGKLSKQLKFVFKPLFSANQYQISKNVLSAYNISYFPKKDGKQPKSFEIRISLYPSQKWKQCDLDKETLRLRAMHCFENYVSIVSEKSSIPVRNDRKKKIKNTIGTSIAWFEKINYKWSSQFKYGYAICHLRKNYEMVIVNALFNEPIDQDVNLFSLKFKNRNKCQVCKQKKNKTIPLKQCSKCLHAIYCSRHCQKYDWNKRHRYVCVKFDWIR